MALSSVSSSDDDLSLTRLRSRVHTSPRGKRLEAAVLFYLQERMQPIVSCTEPFGAGECEENCETVAYTKIRYIKPTAEIVRARRCEVVQGVSLLSHLSEYQLNTLLNSIIDLEILFHLKLTCSPALDPLKWAVIDKMTSELKHQVNRARFINLEETEDDFEKVLNNLELEEGKYLEGSKGDSPSIKQAVYNYLLQNEDTFGEPHKRQLYRLVVLFLDYLDAFSLPPPSSQTLTSTSSPLEASTSSSTEPHQLPELTLNQPLYREHYERWLACVELPKRLKSFTNHKTSDIFGRPFLSQFLALSKQKLLLDYLTPTPTESSNAVSDSLLLKYFIFPEFTEYLINQLLDEESTSLYWNDEVDFSELYAQFDETLQEVGRSPVEVPLMEELGLELKSSSPVTSASHFDVKGLEKWSIFTQEYKDYFADSPEDKENTSPPVISKIIIEAAKHCLPLPINKTLRDYLLSSCVNSEVNSGEIDEEKCDNDEKIDQEEEAEGEFVILRNAGDNLDTEMANFLIEYISIVNLSLPHMGRPYISRLVLEPRHRTMALVLGKNGPERRVVGGICYLPFPTQGFSEIVFVAVAKAEQVKGFGSRLMNQVKEAHTRMGILHLLTYADNNATGFFAKHNFTRAIGLPTGRFRGFLKDYSDATLVECKISPLIPYSRMAQLIREQKKEIRCIVEARKVEDVDLDDAQFDGAVIGLEQLRAALPSFGFTSRLADFTDHTDELMPKLAPIVDAMRGHRDGGLFWGLEEKKHEVDGAPYFINLKVISERLQAGYYKNVAIFQADVKRMLEYGRKWNEDVEEIADRFWNYTVRQMNSQGLGVKVTKKRRGSN